MDLNKKLSLLTGNPNYNPDEELAGISPSYTTSSTSKEFEEDEEDFSSGLHLGELSIDSYLQESGYQGKKSKKKSKKKKKYETLFEDLDIPSSTSKSKNPALDKLTERTKRLIEEAEIASADEFDTFLDDESIFSAEEDAEMRNNLVSLGRKYARDSATSKESSEISKAFADSEKRLKTLYEEVDQDKSEIQKDINRMRVPGRGGKTLADLLEIKNSMRQSQVQIVKEVNALRKSVFELRAKEAARKEAEALGSTDINANTLQNIFSSARSSLVNSMGGYSGVSGAQDETENGAVVYSDFVASDDMDDEEIQRRYFKDQSGSSDADGDKFLEYENRGVEYVLLLDEENHVEGVLAEDKDGILIPDYPLPSNIDELSFDFDFSAMMASDNMHRNYKIRKS